MPRYQKATLNLQAFMNRFMWASLPQTPHAPDFSFITNTKLLYARAQQVCMGGGIWPRLGMEKRGGGCELASRVVRELEGTSVSVRTGNRY